jgi:hypothetical protein
MNDVRCLVDHLHKDFPNIKPSSDPAWSREPALRVIDCVLSLRRNYDRFVVPRLARFESRLPQVKTVQSLRDCMDGYASPHNFVREALDYRDTDRARILDEVINRVLEFANTASGKSELDRLELWASQAPPDGYKVRRIRGFALAGYQYLRMLFGANTTKPDIHICRYVSHSIGRKATDLEALRLLEEAAKLSGIRLRDLDTTIWETSARPSG